MEVILNEWSLDGQFSSYEDFAGYMQNTFLPFMDVLIEKEIPFLKKTDIYSRRITKRERLQDLLERFNDPLMQLLKQYIVRLAYCEPYWDNEPATDKEAVYEFPVVSEVPNCFTEAIGRRAFLFSVRHPVFAEKLILCKYNGKDMELPNMLQVGQLLCTYLEEYPGDIKFVLETYPFKRDILLADADGRCSAQRDLLENELETGDFQNIIEAIPLLIEDLEQGRKSDRWDKLQDDIFEFRIHVSKNRIFRLLFIQDRKIRFLCGFIKKSQKPPKVELERAAKIRKKLKQKG